MSAAEKSRGPAATPMSAAMLSGHLTHESLQNWLNLHCSKRSLLSRAAKSRKIAFAASHPRCPISTTSASDLTMRAASRARTSLSSRPARLLVSEIFRSVQGEGPNTGRPSVFLRLGVCNLSCIWCDTPYTWLFTEDEHSTLSNRAAAAGVDPPPPPFSRARELARREVHDVAQELLERARGCAAVVVTGGEPLIHVRSLVRLVPVLLDAGLGVEFETNGTLSPLGLPPGVHLNVSPKLANSLIPREQRLRLSSLRECLDFPSSVLKFVIGGQDDVQEVLSIVRLVGVHPSRVYLMPLGTNSEEIRERGRWLVDVCIEHGFNYSHRVHVELWGDRRGV